MFLLLLTLVVAANTCMMATRAAARYALMGLRAAHWLVADFIPPRM